MQFSCSICDLFHLTNAVSLVVSYVRIRITTIAQVIVKIIMLPSCPLSPCTPHQKLHKLNPESEKKNYKLSGLYVFSDQNIIFIQFIYFFHMEVLRTRIY